MNNKKKPILIILVLLLAVLVVFSAVACSNKTSDDVDDDETTDPTIKKLTQNEALDKIYNGLVKGNTEMSQAASYGVVNLFDLYLETVVNYRITYKANYKENSADSEIYLSVFDYEENMERFSFLYDGGDLYLSSGEDKSVVKAFGSSMLFGSFYEGCKRMDMTGRFYDGSQIASVFNRNESVNLGMILSQNNITYNKVGESGESIILSDLDLTVINDTLSFFFENSFKGIDEKFDLISQKFLGFKLSRLIETRFSHIYAQSITMMFEDSAVKGSEWVSNGTLQGNVHDFKIGASVSYNDGTTTLEEKTSIVKSKYPDANVGRNDFEGTIIMPDISDQEFDLSIETDINVSDNSLNKLNLRISDALAEKTSEDFISLYYTGGTAYLDASGFYRWLDGAVDLDAFNLPKVYLENLDLSKLIAAGYNNLAKVLLALVRSGFGYDGTDDETKELYEKIMANFSDNGKDTIYYTITEELVKEIRNDDESTMSIVAKALGIEEKQLASYIGEDFFSSAKLVIGYNLETDVITVTMYEKEKTVFIAEMFANDFNGVYIPDDCRKESAVYSLIKYPDYATVEIDASLSLTSGQQTTDASRVFGAFIGDVDGTNTPYALNNGETLLIKGSVTQSIVDETAANFVSFDVYSKAKSNATEKLVMSVRSNPYVADELLVSYYAQMGSLTADENDGLFYRIKRSVVQESLNSILGDDNIFNENNVLSILTAILDSQGSTQITKANGWFEMSLLSDDENDPVNKLIGIKNCTARIKMRAVFDGVNDNVNVSAFVTPEITPLDSVTVESIYSKGSAWKTEVEVVINSKKIIFTPTYVEDTVKIETGKNVYHPVAKLFGKEISYELRITGSEGTYKIADLYDRVLTIDPTVSKTLPSEIKVRYDNNAIGSLPCVFTGFEESNITLAGYNLAGFAEDYEKCVKSKVTIGIDSIMHKEYEIYILVNNRKILPAKDSSGQEMFDNTGVPVVGSVEIDPYTYAMTRSENPSYNPVTSMIESKGIILCYDNVYGEETVLEGNDEVTKELTYDILGINKFVLSELDLSWDYDLSKITWQGSLGYAYAVVGADTGYPVKIAVKVIVSAQTVDYIKIDNEENGKYTIDFLKKETYTIPSQSSVRHDVYIYFYSADASAQKRRKLVAVRPDGITDTYYYENYALGSLEWEGAEYIAKNPTIIKVNGTNNLFGEIPDSGRSGNATKAMFGNAMAVGEQEVKLEINVPTRYQSSQNMQEESVAISCVEGENGIPEFNSGTVGISPARFTAESEFYAPYEINPYDAAARLPSTVFLKVANSSANSLVKFSDDLSNYEVKEYAVEWVTTDENGKELNLIERKDDDRFGLKNPVVTRQDFVVYGKIGDRGGNDATNPGYVWIKMIVRNLASKLTDISFEGLEAGETEITIDPYKSYSLPKSFTASLESGKTISQQNIEWEVSVRDKDDWFPINYKQGYDRKYYDKSDKYIFSYEGGQYELRYIIEGGTEVIKQEIILLINVPERKLVVNSDGRNYVDIYNGNDFVYAYNKLNTYEEYSTVLIERLRKIEKNGFVSVAFSNTKEADGSYVPYSLAVQWTTAEEGYAGYDNSIDRLLAALTTSPDGKTIELKGSVYTGTINEQVFTVGFSFVRLNVKEITLDRLYVAAENEAANVEGADGPIAMSDIIESGKIRLNITKAFGLKNEEGKFASPYEYINYLFGEIQLEFENGSVSDTVPVIDFCGYDKESFNKKALYGDSDETYSDCTDTEIKITKLSQGSALQEITIVIHTLKDERLESSKEIVAELFDEQSEELFGENKDYALPTSIKVKYNLSGDVIYDTPSWTVGATTKPYLNVDTATGIPVRFINTLRRDANVEKQPSSYDFSFKFPCEDESYYITVRIPRKDIDNTKYNATDDTGLYTITEGVLTIDNPYLYYTADSEYGMDVTKIPSLITAEITSKYEETGLNTHYVEWNFIKGVFDPAKFAEGLDRVKFATATLKAYYDAAGNRQTQTVDLYITVKSLVYYGISYGELPIAEGEDGNKNVITVDPYNDVMGYKGDFRLPTVGLTVLFNAGLDSFVFGTADNPVTFKLFDDDGNVLNDNLVNVPYTEKGHSLGYEALKDVKVLTIRAYIPGYENGLPLYLDIQSRNIENVSVGNFKFDESGELIGTEYLAGVYFIDPYNSATFMLPSEVSVKFRENKDYTTQKVAGWEIIGDDGNALSLDSDKNFYVRKDSSDAVSYGFYKADGESYKGKNYKLRGYISLGRTSTGTAGRQYFTVYAIVLNRSLKEKYSTHYMYEDPLGGLLSDIPSALTEEMFVDYDRYYAKLDLPDGCEYSAWSCPIIPTVNWSIGNVDSIIDYKGGFDKDIEGNVYYPDTNVKVLLGILSEETNASYEQLIKAKMWDGYFTSSGAPQAYSSATVKRLVTLKEKFDKEVIKATYDILLAEYNGGDEKERQLANYLANTLTNKIIAEYGYNRLTEFNDIAYKMFEKVKESYEAESNTNEIEIYATWKEIYDAFVAVSDENSPDLSAYQRLKAAKYDECESNLVFTNDERNGMNARLRARIEASLKIYVNADIWDALYDKALASERSVMDVLIKGNTVSAKSSALGLFRVYEALHGSVGETAYANITAPSLDIGKIIEKYDSDGNPVYKTEFIFNVYSSLSFVEEVDVETSLNYYPVLKKYVEEGIRLAMEDIRQAKTGEALSAYIARVTEDYVNSIVPTIIDTDKGGEEKKIIDFTYVYGEFNESSTAYKGYWNTLYLDKQTSAVAHISKLPGDTDKERWDAAYKTHRLAKDGMCEEMEQIEARNGENFTKMFEEYAEVLKKRATAEMDGYLAEATADANVKMVDYIMEKNNYVKDILNSCGGAQGAFAIMFEEIGENVYDKLYASYSSGEKLSVIEKAYTAADGGNGTSKAKAVYYLMKGSQSVSNEIKERAENIFYYFLGGATAFDTMKSNASTIGLTETDINYLYEAAIADGGSLSESRYNGAFTEEEFEEFRKTAIIKSLLTNFKGSSNAATISGWISDAIRSTYSAGYEKIAALKDEYVELRENKCGITLNAFVKYVKAYESKGDEVKASIEEKTEYYQNKYVFDNSEKIVTNLLNNSSFDYKNKLLVTDETEIKRLKTEALEYYLKSYADSKTANAINYFIYLYGDVAYDKLCERDDLGSKFIADLKNAYYYVLLENMKNDVKENLTVTDNDKQSSQYKTLSSNVNAMFCAVAAVSGETTTLNFVQTAKMEADVEAQYLAIKYSAAVKAYTEEVRNLVSASERTVNGLVYDDIYGTDSAIFDEINAVFAAASDTLYSEAYKYFRQKLIENEASFYYDAEEDVIDTESKNYAYGLLDSYGFKTVDEEDEAKAFVDKVYAEYESLGEEEKETVSAIVGDVFTEEIEYYEKAAKLFDIYAVLKKNSDKSIAAVAEKLVSAIENAAVIESTGDTDKVLTEGIRTSVGQILYKNSAFLSKYNLTASENVTEEAAAIIGVETYAVYLELIKTVCSLRKDVNEAYLSDDNNDGDFTVTSEEYNAAYIDILLRVLKNGVGGKVLGVSYDVIQSAIDGKADEIRKDIDNNGKSTYRDKIIARMVLTSAHSDINAGEKPLTTSEYIASKTSYVDEIILKRYVADAVGNNDNERKKNVLELTEKAYGSIVTFKTEDHAESEDDNRKVIVFDKSALVEGSGSAVKSPVYIGNKYKITSDYGNAYKIDSIDYRYLQVVVKYVDFTDKADVSNIATYSDRNYIEIDPLAPFRPEKVHAYGEYQATGSTSTVVFDMGYVDVSYCDVFDENIYSGQDRETTSYYITLTDRQGQSYSLSVATKYINRTIKKIYVDTEVYGGEKVSDGSEYNGLNCMTDETGVNKFTINPINESVLNVVDEVYVMPETFTATFADGSSQQYEEAEWDLSEAEYSLAGRKEINLRLLGYTVKFDDGTSRKVSFDYAKNTITVVSYDANDTAVTSGTYNNVPDKTIWNMTLDITDQTPKSVVVENLDGTRSTIGTIAANGSYIDVSKDMYTLNPFDVVFPSGYKIIFNDGTESSLIEDGGWKLEAGANGTYKLQDIIMGTAGDNNVMTEFTYLGYKIRARIVADDIELDGLVDGEYYDGGTLYLVKGGGSVFEQLERNYSCFYYNFSNIAGIPDYRKIPLSFIDANISSISTENEALYRDVKGVLGWDKKAYPGGMTMSPNIKFTIAVIDPQMYAKYDGETNKYVVVDYLGMPYDSNYQKKNDVNEPAIADYLIKITTGSEEIKFYIDSESIDYNFSQQTVTFDCIFGMTSGEAKLVADKDGGKDISFSVTMPLFGYLYTAVRDAEFDKTPVKNAKGEDLWKWTAVSEDSLEYRDGIMWELGKELKASYLPKVSTTVNGETIAISLLWDLDGINVNASTVNTARGSYTAKGYYYNGDGTWICKELAIFVEKFDAADMIVDNLGGSTTLKSEYNGQYYTLPLDLESEKMYMLRKDGSYGALDASVLTVEYKAENDEDRKYSTDKLPLNAGSYNIRVRIDDDNVTVGGELVFKLEITPVTIEANLITFVGESNHTVIYTYDGKKKELVVKDGLPMVTVDNWFGSEEEKQEILDEQLAEGYELITAKSRAYNTLYNRVTPQTREYLDGQKDALGESTGYENDALNAAMFDRLTPNLKICEVVADITYAFGKDTLTEAPTEVGVYTVSYTIKAESNRNNYAFGKNQLSLSYVIEIVQPAVSYGLAETELKYNGLYQNPRISGLHDANGNLPAGVTVTYKYTSGIGVGQKEFTNGIKDVGTYVCEVNIDGGNNYPSDSILNQTVNIVASDLYINIEGASGEYLSAINDVKDKIVFSGLKGYDDKSVFGTADVYTEAKEYFVPGTYGIYLNGFVVGGSQTVYTTIDLTETFEIDGKNYRRLYLKSSNEEGSLYKLIDSGGKYVYSELIAMIGTKDTPGNYNVYVEEKGEYNIYVTTTGDEEVYVVNDDESLNAALDLIKDGDKARIYLNAKDSVKTVYSGIEINVNAVVYIIGCYDADKNIVTYLDSLKVVRGATSVKIIGFEADAEGEVKVQVGSKAGSVTIENCVFNGNGQPYSVGIRTEDGYTGKLLCSSSTFNGFQMGLIAYGGNMEILTCEFGNNVGYGIRIDSDGKDIQIGNCTFVGNNVGLYFENNLVNVRDNSFSANRTAIEAPGSDKIDLSSKNEFDDKNGVEVKV